MCCAKNRRCESQHCCNAVTALQQCCDIVSNSYNIVPTLERCVELKIVVANRPVSPLGFVHSIPGTLIRYVSLHVRVRRGAASLETLFLCLNRSPVRYGFRAALRSTSFPGFSPTRSMGAGRREPWERGCSPI